jgi:hypothetical protein
MYARERTPSAVPEATQPSWCGGCRTKDVTMRPKTTTALALAATTLAPAAAWAADPPSPTEAELRAPLAGHLTAAGHMRAERRANVQDNLTTRAVRLARKAAELRDERFSGPVVRERLAEEAPAELREEIDEKLAKIREAREAARAGAAVAPAPAGGASPALEAIAACESGGDPSAVGGGGLYRGKYQFDMQTWQSVGGTGDPAAAPEAEQDARAAALYAQRGTAPWPVCGG